MENYVRITSKMQSLTDNRKRECIHNTLMKIIEFLINFRIQDQFASSVELTNFVATGSIVSLLQNTAVFDTLEKLTF